MKIIKAKTENAEEIAKLRKDTFKNINAKDYTKEHIISFNKENTLKKTLERTKNRDMFCLLDENNKILGVIDLKNNKIGGFFIHHKHIKKGYGRKLLNFIENYARKKGIRKVILYSTKYGYPFYLKNNYKLIKKGFWVVNNLRVRNYLMEKKFN